MVPPSWVEVIYVIPQYGVSRGLNLNFISVGGRSLKLTDYYRAEAKRYLPDRAKTEARPCEAEARPSQLKKLPRGRLEPRQMPRGLHPWILLLFLNNFLIRMTEKSLTNSQMSARPRNNASNAPARPQTLTATYYGRRRRVELPCMVEVFIRNLVPWTQCYLHIIY